MTSAATNKPPGVTFNVDLAITERKRRVSEFLESTKMQFGTPKPVPVLDVNGKWCNVQISPAVGSVEIQKVREPGAPNGFIVAKIENPDPACKPHKFTLDEHHSAVWIVNFKNTTVQNGQTTKNLGTTRVVVLGNGPNERDKWLTGRLGWVLGQCGHNSGDGKDNATILTTGTVCKLTLQFHHNADSVTTFLRNLITTQRERRPFTDADDPALWFLCGTDCCYAEMR